MDRREFARRSAAGAALAASRGSGMGDRGSEPPSPFELEEKTIVELQDMLGNGRMTSRRLVDLYSRRIAELDGQKHLNHVLQVNPDARSIADQLDTTAGSLALVGAKPPKDSGIARKLREAGAVILGKTNLSEWANFRSSHSTSGWSGRGGQTKNAYVQDRNPCGSSSGSGASAAANLCAAAIGSETDGSVVCPANANSLVGIKPTVGLIGRSGIIPISHSQDTAGPMARTVSDAAILLGALGGLDRNDAMTKRGVDRNFLDYTPFLNKDALRGARLGIAREYFGFNDGVDKLMNDLIAEMKKMGAVIVDPADIPTSGKFDDSELEVLLYEFKADLNSYLARLGPGAQVHSLKDVIDFNE